ncbi:hypothetical protein HPP92_016938 [Vanilla planifolia]|uniref:Uncharacterized protein n=1 Tax=Vanilla planifolia TaxID=51239 RepID=A0A835QR97_VANPL|nr:hypothetical protein HPP92_016938 [Vanilla planifolia]
MGEISVGGGKANGIRRPDVDKFPVIRSFYFGVFRRCQASTPRAVDIISVHFLQLFYAFLEDHKRWTPLLSMEGGPRTCGFFFFRVMETNPLRRHPLKTRECGLRSEYEKCFLSDTFKVYYTMKDLNEDISNSWHLYHENKISNGQIYNGCMLNSLNQCSVYDKDILKRKILEHEAIFRKQVHELHRLYKIQKELMQELLQNGSNRCSKWEINSNAWSSRPDIRTQGCTKIWQTSHWSDIASFQKREKTRVTDAVVYPTKICETNSTPCFGSPGKGVLDRNVASYASLRTCTNKRSDLQLPAVYIDCERSEITEKDFDGSSSMTTVPYSRDSKLYPNGEVKLSLVNISSANGWKGTDNLDSGSKDGFSHGLGDLNEPIEGQTSFVQTVSSFPLQIFESERQLKENHKHNVPLRETKSLLESTLSKDKDFGKRGFSTILPVFNAEITSAWSLKNSKAVQCNGLMNTDSVKEECLMITASGREESSSIFSNDRKKKDTELHKEGNCSVISGKSPGCAIGAASLLDINIASSSMALSSPAPLETMSPFDRITNKLSRLATSSKDPCFCEVGRDLGSQDVQDVSFSSQCEPKKVVKLDSSSTASPNHLFSTPNSNGNACMKTLNLKNFSPKIDTYLNSSCGQNEGKQVLSSGLEGFRLNLHGSEEKPLRDTASNILSREKTFGNIVFNKIDLNLCCLDQEQLLGNNPQHDTGFCNRESVNLEKLSSLEKISSLKNHIDLNCEPLFIDESSFSEVSAKCQISFPSVSKASPRIDMEGPSTSLQEYNIPQIELNSSSERKLFLKNACFNEVVVREAAETMFKLSCDHFKQADDELGSLSTTIPCNDLSWLADMALNTESINTNAGSFCRISSPVDGMDLFELMTLQLEEIKLEEPWFRPRELESSEDNEKTRILLLQTRRGKARKRRQKRDFLKDILPGLATLSRQEVNEDLQTIAELMKASGCPWQLEKVRRNTGRSSMQARGRRQPRNDDGSLKEVLGSIPETFLSDKNVHNTEFEVERFGMIGWGRTRRCGDKDVLH